MRDDDEEDVYHDDEDGEPGADDEEQSPLRDVPAPAPRVATPLLPRAQKLLTRWERTKKMELEEDCDRNALAEALLEKLITLEGHRHLGAHLAEWLMERPEVADVFATDEELEADLRRP